MLATEATIHQADAFALLEHYGAESAGSLTLLPEGSPISENDTVPLSDTALEKRIGNLPNLSLAHGANKRMSLAGAQHKLAVIYTDNQFNKPQGNTASTHILKPDHPSTAFAQSVINEWFVMQLAGRVGLNVPPVHRRYVASTHDSAVHRSAVLSAMGCVSPLPRDSTKCALDTLIQKIRKRFGTNVSKICSGSYCRPACDSRSSISVDGLLATFAGFLIIKY